MLWKYHLFFLAVYFLKNGEGLSRIDPLVDTKLGLIRGLQAQDGQYSMFMGIPYATVNISNPFGPSTPHQEFNEVFEAFDDSAICPQVEEFNKTIVGSLDCLHLNVYVPNTASSKNKLPVLVWIYGGSFSIGFAGRYLYGPNYLVRHDIILVTLNYRVGPYGFMCLNNADVPGNQGIKDQFIALKWVKDNIEAFGGDVNKITIFGESAGAYSVDFHLYYQKERLFNQVILQSGSAQSPGTIIEPNTLAFLALAEHLGFKTNNEQEALSFLSTADTKLVIAAGKELDLLFRPCVEKEFDGSENSDEFFINDHPYNAPLASLKNTPILVGINNRESLFLLEEREKNFMDENIFRKFLDDNFNLEIDQTNEMEEIIRHFYIGDDSVSEDRSSSIIDFVSDYKFNYSVIKSIQYYLKYGAENIFQYVFSYEGSRNFVKDRLKLNESGASHADEIGYLFDISYMEEPTPDDQRVIDSITTLWSNFVKYGNPTPEISELTPVTWKPVSQDVSYYLDIDAEISLKQRPFHSRMAFWELFYKIHEKAQKGLQNSDA